MVGRRTVAELCGNRDHGDRVGGGEDEREDDHGVACGEDEGAVEVEGHSCELVDC